MPKAHGVTYMAESLRLAWYKVHEPEAFYMAWAEENAGKLHRYRDDILEAVKDVKTMECWLLKNCDFDMKFGEKLPVMRVLQEMLLRGIDVGEIIDPM